MKTPDYSIANSAEVYKYHSMYEPHRRFTRSMYRLLNRIMQPTVSYNPETQKRLPIIVEKGHPLILAPNHTSDRHDQWTAAAVAHQLDKDFNFQLVGDIRVLAKSTFYTGELRREMGIPALAQSALTSFVNNMGTMPVYRPNDLSSETRKQSVEAVNQLWDTSSNLMISGHPIGIFPEGTADTLDPSHNLPIKAGLGKLACITTQKISPETSVHILPIGISYPEFTRRTNRKGNEAVIPSVLRGSHVHIGEIYDVTPDDSVNTVNREVARILQDATTQAFAEQRPVIHDNTH